LMDHQLVINKKKLPSNVYITEPSIVRMAMKLSGFSDFHISITYLQLKAPIRVTTFDFQTAV